MNYDLRMQENIHTQKRTNRQQTFKWKNSRRAVAPWRAVGTLRFSQRMSAFRYWPRNAVLYRCWATILSKLEEILGHGADQSLPYTECINTRSVHTQLTNTFQTWGTTTTKQQITFGLFFLVHLSSIKFTTLKVTVQLFNNLPCPFAFTALSRRPSPEPLTDGLGGLLVLGYRIRD